MAMDAHEAIERLKAGNAAYVGESQNTGDISPARVQQLSREGQAPFACVVTCADSRVVPEHIFMAGLGELFTIRVAGNVMGDMELASCVYAAEHLGVKLIVVLGHTQCGAVASALEALGADGAAPGVAADDDAPSGAALGVAADGAAPSGAAPDDDAPGGALDLLIAGVIAGIGDERDPHAASIANARAGVAALLADCDIAHLVETAGLVVRPALYHTETGTVEFLD